MTGDATGIRPAPQPAEHPEPAPPPLSEIARQWGRIGCVGFGGPPAHIALLRELCVERRHWLTNEQFERAIAATNLLPGPASTQLAIYCAWRLRGTRGALLGGRLLHRAGTHRHHRAGRAVPVGVTAPVGAWSGHGRRGRRRRRRAARRSGNRRPDLGTRSRPPCACARLRPRRRACSRAHRSVARAGAARLRRARARLGHSDAATRERAPASAAGWHLWGRGSRVPPHTRSAYASPPGRHWPPSPSRQPARAGLDRPEGRRAGLRRWLRDRAADASRRRQHLPLDVPYASSSTRWPSGRSRPGPLVQTVAVVGYAAAGLPGALLAAVVAFAPPSRSSCSAPTLRAAAGNERVLAFLAGAAPAAAGAIVGSAVPLAARSAAAGSTRCWPPPACRCCCCAVPSCRRCCCADARAS